VSEAELMNFDILTHPASELNPGERNEVKKFAREVLRDIKALRVSTGVRRIQCSRS
jgi:hypothetical protein